MKPPRPWSLWSLWWLVLATASVAQVQGSVPPIQWQCVFGGAEPEYISAMRETADGGLILGLARYSEPSGIEYYPTMIPPDYWVVRMDAQGALVWEKTLGGSQVDYLTALVLLGDGSILVGGKSVSPISGNKTTARPDWHAWLVCLDTQGNKLWEQSMEGIGNDELASMNETRDGGVILAIESSSEPGGDKTAAHYGAQDFWIVRLNANGQAIWDRAYGGNAEDYPVSIRQTSDGGFIVVGLTRSGPDGNKSSPAYGNGDYWVLRLDALGNKRWERTLGGTGWDEGRDVQETVDGGFLVVGTSESGVSGNKRSASFGMQDYWLVKLDAQGTILWDRAAGGTGTEILRTTCKTPDRGFLLCGYSYAWSKGGTLTSTNHGWSDAWILRLDEQGRELWQEHYGGSDYECGGTIVQTKDGGYVFAIMSSSDADGNKSEPNVWEQQQDAWLFKTGPDALWLRPLQQEPAQIREEGFRLQLSGPADAYAVEVSTNGLDWELLEELVLTNNAMEIVDPAAASSPRRLYKVRTHASSGL